MRRRPPWNPRLWLVLAALAVAPVAWSGPFGLGKKRAVDDATDSDTDDPAAEAPPPGLPAAGPLFGAPLPLDPGPLAPGLANASAQGCAGCHWEATETWAASAHARPPSETLLVAAADANSPRCLACHLPLRPQHRDLVVYDGGSSDAPRIGPNPDFDATLSTEGVTCAACHLRDGQVVGSRPDAIGPHAGAWSAELADAGSCATCHQLSWPGAEQPLYDTFGEWQRSAYASAGVGCVDCHLRPGTASGPVSHDVTVPTERALSLLVALPPEALVRGGAAQEATITVQNTGAGHAVPTGSPFVGLRLTVALEGPATKGSDRATWGAPLVVDLGRKVGDAAPWPITTDTRLQAGGQRVDRLALELPVDAPRGAYALVASLTETRNGEPSGEARELQRIPLRVE